MAYSDAFVTEALIKLAYNKHDHELTARQLNISSRTLKNWEKKYPKKTVPELLDRALSRLLTQLPINIPAKDYGIIVGILFDKWLLMHGRATSRHEAVLQRLDGMTEDDWTDVQHEMERILAGEDSGRVPVSLPE